MVEGFAIADVRREIEAAKAGDPAGNFLAALGLLCYTEVLGGISRGVLAPGNGRQNFEECFGSLGDNYKNLLETGFDAYSILRCGMAHEYLVKGRAQIAMLGSGGCGVRVDSDQHVFFTVEDYFSDFVAYARLLRQDLIAEGRTLPPELDGRL